MPEEINRVVTDRLSDYLFAPSPDAVDNLRARATASDQIHLVGNVMIDTLLANLDRAARRGGHAAAPGRRCRRPVRPGHAAPAGERRRRRQLGALRRALGRGGAADARSCSPPIPARRAGSGGSNVRSPTRVRVIAPLGYLDFLALQAPARVVLTDSGGVQEETTVLGVPCLTLRENTERPITVTEGTNQLVGRDPHAIVAAAYQVLDHGVEARRPALWDGRAGRSHR